MGRNLLILIIMGLAAPAAVQAEQRLSLELGGWTTGLEYETPWGAFVDLHSPWAMGVLEIQRSDLDWVIPIGARAGCAGSLGAHWSIRAAFRADLMWWNNRASRQSLYMLMIEFGFRWQHESGFRAGVDLVPLGWEHGIGGDDPDDGFQIWEAAILFTQVSVGWSWSL